MAHRQNHTRSGKPSSSSGSQHHRGNNHSHHKKSRLGDDENIPKDHSSTREEPESLQNSKQQSTGYHLQNTNHYHRGGRGANHTYNSRQHHGRPQHLDWREDTAFDSNRSQRPTQSWTISSDHSQSHKTDHYTRDSKQPPLFDDHRTKHKHQIKSTTIDNPHREAVDREYFEEHKTPENRDFKKNRTVWNPRHTTRNRSNIRQHNHDDFEINLGLVSSSFECKSLYKFLSAYQDERFLDREQPDLGIQYFSNEGSQSAHQELEEVENKYLDRIKELDFLENDNQNDVLVKGDSLANYVQVKKANFTSTS